MTGIVLSGGQSSRMGADKGLLKLEAKTWAQTAVDKLGILGLPVKVSVNNAQHAQYAEVFGEAKLVVDNDPLPVRGPLLGVLSCHRLFPQEDLFVFACDLPLMDASMLKQLMEQYHSFPGAQAYLYSNENEPEPLCGIYTAGGLSVATALLLEGKLTRFSMKHMIDHLEVRMLPVREEEKKYFRNFNAHAELNGL